jgi:hypothetical protein
MIRRKSTCKVARKAHYAFELQSLSVLFIHWFAIDIEEYIKLVRCRAQIIWLGRLGLDIDTLKSIFVISGIKTRACHIQPSERWLNFIDSCYSLDCVVIGHKWRKDEFYTMDVKQTKLAT